MSLICPQPILRVGLVEFGTRQDKRRNGLHYHGRKCYQEVANILVTCYEDVSDLSGVLLAYYEEVSDKLRRKLRVSCVDTAPWNLAFSARGGRVRSRLRAVARR